MLIRGGISPEHDSLSSVPSDVRALFDSQPDKADAGIRRRTA